MQIRRMSEAGEHSARLVEAAPLDVEDLADAGLGSGKDGIGDVKRYDRDAAVFEDVEHLLGLRSEERRVGKEGVGTFRARWWPSQKKKKTKIKKRIQEK